jgi:hypothetical protein
MRELISCNQRAGDDYQCCNDSPIQDLAGKAEAAEVLQVRCADGQVVSEPVS